MEKRGELIYEIPLPIVGFGSHSCNYILVKGSPTPEERAKLINECAKNSFLDLAELPQLEWRVDEDLIRVDKADFNVYIQETLRGRERVLAVLPINEGLQKLHCLAQHHMAFRIYRPRSIEEVAF